MEIVEIIGPSAQGYARPYKCRGEDDKVYYVKGIHSGRDAQYKEWLCGHLAKKVGLAIPPFRIVNINAELMAETQPAWQELGVGPAFGSEEQTHAVWFEPESTARVPVEQQRLILAFDWWIANGDRTKGNTNLLFDQTEGKIVVIDHNNALDPDLQFVEFCENHIFGAQYESVFKDLVSIAELQERFGRAASGLAGWLAQAPVSWKWTNPEEDVPTRFDAQSAVHTLAQRTRLAKDGLHG